MVGKFSGKSKAEGTEENLKQSRKAAKVRRRRGDALSEASLQQRGTFLAGLQQRSWYELFRRSLSETLRL